MKWGGGGEEKKTHLHTFGPLRLISFPMKTMARNMTKTLLQEEKKRKRKNRHNI